MTANPLVRIHSLTKAYQQGTSTLEVFKNISFDIPEGQLIGLVGASGSGKSTLLHLLGLLDTPTAGEMLYQGKSFESFSEKERDSFRRHHLGFIFQFHHLLPDFTAEENVMFPCLMKGLSHEESKREAATILEAVGLQERLHHYPSELSGGEQQRVAIARAFVHKPSLILADEPTGNLDEETAMGVLTLFESIVKQQKTTAFIVTHNLELAGRFDTTYRLKNKSLEEVTR